MFDIVYLVRVELNQNDQRIARSFVMKNREEVEILRKHVQKFGGRISHDAPHPVSDWVNAMDVVEQAIEQSAWLD